MAKLNISQIETAARKIVESLTTDRGWDVVQMNEFAHQVAPFEGYLLQVGLAKTPEARQSAAKMLLIKTIGWEKKAPHCALTPKGQLSGKQSDTYSKLFQGLREQIVRPLYKGVMEYADAYNIFVCVAGFLADPQLTLAGSEEEGSNA